MPSQEDYNRDKFDRLAREHTESYKRCAYASPTSQDQKIAAAMHLIPLEKVDTLLDAGCGDGRFLKSVLRSRGNNGLRPRTVIGVDISKEMLSLCNPMIRDYYGRAFFYAENIENMTSIEDECVDALTCLGVIQCFEDYMPAIKEFHRVLVDEGQLLIIGLDKATVDPSKKPEGYDLHDTDVELLRQDLGGIGFAIEKTGSVSEHGTGPLHAARDFFILARKTDAAEP